MYNFFFCSKRYLYCIVVLLESFFEKGIFIGFLIRWLCMGSIIKSLEFVVFFRIFKINCKLIGWVFCFVFWEFVCFVLYFSYRSFITLCREILFFVLK